MDSWCDEVGAIGQIGDDLAIGHLERTNSRGNVEFFVLRNILNSYG